MREKKKGEDVREEVHSLRQRLFDFQDSVAKTNNNFGGRIGALEAREAVHEEQYDNLREKLDDIKKEVAEAQREQKGSIAELRKEHKESMDELKKGNKEILDIVAPMRQKADNVEKLEKDVETLKSKDGQTWDHIKKQSIGWFVGIVGALLAVATGLSQFLS